ncbi:hypothetical protein DITRI_Ditri07aG0046000 [Diplodiscus trichospermus]
MCSLQLQTKPFLTLSIANSYPTFLTYPSSICMYKLESRTSSCIQEFPPNALRRKSNPQWRGGFNLGVDLGLSRTGLALNKGFLIRPFEDGKETPQSNKVHSIAEKLVIRAAERKNVIDCCNSDLYNFSFKGLGKSARRKSSDAYAAVLKQRSASQFLMIVSGVTNLVAVTCSLGSYSKLGSPSALPFPPKVRRADDNPQQSYQD